MPGYEVDIRTENYQGENWFLKKNIWNAFGYSAKNAGFKVKHEDFLPGFKGYVFVNLDGVKELARRTSTFRIRALNVIKWLQEQPLVPDEVDEQTLPDVVSDEQAIAHTFGSGIFKDVRWTIVDGELLAVALDVAKALGYTKPEKTIRNRLADTPPPLRTRPEQDKVYVDFEDSFGTQRSCRVISIGDINVLIMSAMKQSNNPLIRERAKEFNRYVCYEVLPSIQTKGYYVRPGAEESVKQDFSMVPERATFSMDEAMTLVNSKDKNAQFYEIMMSRLDKKDKQIEELTRLVGKLVDKLD